MSMKIQFDPPLYMSYLAPNGFLVRDIECHALWHYYVTAISTYKSEMDDIKYEHVTYRYNYGQLYMSIATMYHADPNKMQNFWPAVDLQAGALRLTLLPKDKKYRQPINFSYIQ